jgi:hypothetical protein
MIVSTVRFAVDSRKGARTRRQLAALSAAMTAVIVAMLYSGVLVANVPAAARFVGGAGTSHEIYLLMSAVDGFLTRIANLICRSLSVRQVGYRPSPPIWPAGVLWAGYLARFAIHRYHRRSHNGVSALTGSVYWSHVTACAIAVAFLIVVVGWSPLLVVPTSVAAITVLVVSVKSVVEDLMKVAMTAIHTVIAAVSSIGKWLAYVATEAARHVRRFLRLASKAYLNQVRAPLRRRLAALERWNEELKVRMTERLRLQEARNAEEFGND